MQSIYTFLLNIKLTYHQNIIGNHMKRAEKEPIVFGADYVSLMCTKKGKYMTWIMSSELRLERVILNEAEEVTTDPTRATLM